MGVDAMSVEDLKKLNKNKKLVKKLGECPRAGNMLVSVSCSPSAYRRWTKGQWRSCRMGVGVCGVHSDVPNAWSATAAPCTVPLQRCLQCGSAHVLLVMGVQPRSTQPSWRQTRSSR